MSTIPLKYINLDVENGGRGAKFAIFARLVYLMLNTFFDELLVFLYIIIIVL